MDDGSAQVRRRRVFYIPGYDPIHPRRYRELYRKEGAEQAAISGYAMSLSPKAKGSGAYGWHVTGRMGGAEVEADVEVLVWSDIVRDSMSGSIPATYWHLIRTAWTYIASGTLRRLMWLRKGPVIAALYPVGMLLVQLALGLVAAFGAMTLARVLLEMTTRRVISPLLLPLGESGLAVVFGIIGAVVTLSILSVGLGTLWLVLRWFKRQDGRFFAYYLMHDYAFSARWNGANPPALETRMAEFGKRIAAALTPEVDEVLVVGHSSGAHLAVSILADLIRAGHVPAGGQSRRPALSLLSLGQVVPMVSFLPAAHRLRADLAMLSASHHLTWVDVTAPGDGCAFALCDPVAVSGVAPANRRWPLVLSAAFTQTLSPERWRKLRWRFFRLHFQYLCAFDRPGHYDYFAITAGPLTLGQRYAGKAPSASRIDVPASKHTSVAA